MKDKLQQLIVELNKNLVGKEKVIKLSLLTMLAGENLILFGKPGTAKSEIARRLSKVFKEEKKEQNKEQNSNSDTEEEKLKPSPYFEYLLTKFTTPEEIFGPLSIKELKQDRFRRNVKGYMPNVKVAFLDEIFKANSSILNSLLTIINEKIYHNRNEKIKVPLQSLISASNELPIGDNELNALYDRFLVRVVVNYLSDDDVNELFDVEDEEFNTSDSLKMKIEEIEKIKQETKNVEIPEEIRTCIMEIRRNFNETFKEDKDEVFSDRKFVKIMKFLKVSAYTNGRNKVDLSDVYLLTNCLWNREDNSTKLSSIITKVVQSNVSINIDNASLIDKNYKKRDSKKTNFDFKGDGTEYNPFLIEDINDLRHINSDDYRDKGYYFEQTGDIDLSSITKWISIGENEENPFSGHYNGSNHKILNLTGDSGLFGVIDENSSIQNLGLENIDIKSKLNKLGGILNINNGLMNNCYVIGVMTYENVHNDKQIVCYIGGLNGINRGLIKNCFNESIISVKGSQTFIGGISGENEGYISSCYNIEQISSYPNTLSGNKIVGGITGRNGGEIDNCFNHGIIRALTSCGKPSYAGGIAGDNSKNIINCYNLGYISSASVFEAHAGGIAGINRREILNSLSLNKGMSGNIINKNTSDAIETDCYTCQEMSATYKDKEISFNNVKKIPLSLINEKFFNNCNWDFETIWIWDNKENRPRLNMQSTKKLYVEDFNREKYITMLKENIWL